MKTRLLPLTVALLMSVAGAAAQTTGGTTTPTTPTHPTPPTDHPAPPTVGPNDQASDTAKAVHTLLDQFRAQRADFIAARQALIEKLKTATDDERKAILAELRDDQKSRVEDQRAMGKEIRDEVKKIRDQKKSGG